MSCEDSGELFIELKTEYALKALRRSVNYFMAF